VNPFTLARPRPVREAVRLEDTSVAAYNGQATNLTAGTLAAAVPRTRVRSRWLAQMWQREWLIVLLLAAWASFLFGWRLTTPDQYIYDEVYHAYTAAQYADGNTDAWLWSTKAPKDGVAYEWTHPPLGKLIMAAGIWIAGDDPFGWRIASAVSKSAAACAASRRPLLHLRIPRRRDRCAGRAGRGIRFAPRRAGGAGGVPGGRARSEQCRSADAAAHRVKPRGSAARGRARHCRGDRPGQRARQVAQRARPDHRRGRAQEAGRAAQRRDSSWMTSSPREGSGRNR